MRKKKKMTRKVDGQLQVYEFLHEVHRTSLPSPHWFNLTCSDNTSRHRPYSQRILSEHAVHDPRAAFISLYMYIHHKISDQKTSHVHKRSDHNTRNVHRISDFTVNDTCTDINT